MTKVTIGEDYIEISGHSPKKIVCHGLSAISQMTANYLEKCKLADVAMCDDAYLKIFNVEQNETSIFLLEAFVDAIKDIENSYPGNIEIEFVC